MSACSASPGSSPRGFTPSYSSSPTFTTISLSFPEAIYRVLSGSMNLSELFRQFSKELQAALNAQSKVLCGQEILGAPRNVQNDLMQDLLDDITHPPRQGATLVDMIGSVAQGNMRPGRLWSMLTDEARKGIVPIVQAKFGKEFSLLETKQQKEVFTALHGFLKAQQTPAAETMGSQSAPVTQKVKAERRPEGVSGESATEKGSRKWWKFW